MHLSFREKVKLAESNCFTKEQLLYLLEDNHSHIRIKLAINKATPVFALKILSRDPDYGVRAAVAQNANTTSHILKYLSNDKVFCVLKSVALNEKTPKHILEKLLQKRKTLSQFIAQNENSSQQVLKEIYVRNNSSKKKDIYTLSNLASNPNIGSATFEKLIFHSDYTIRSASVSNRLATVEQLKELIEKESSIFVRKKVATSNILSNELIKMLSNDENLMVLYGLVSNKNVTRETLSKILNRVMMIKILSR